PEGVKISGASGQAPKVPFASDADPREFLLDIEAWPAGAEVKLTVTYSACVGDACHTVRQRYVLRLQRDRDGGRARGEGAGFWDPEQFARRLLEGDKDGDGKLSEGEVMGLARPHFAHFDADKDGLLDPEELRQVAEWLNTHHMPGVPAEGKR